VSKVLTVLPKRKAASVIIAKHKELSITSGNSYMRGTGVPIENNSPRA